MDRFENEVYNMESSDGVFNFLDVRVNEDGKSKLPADICDKIQTVEQGDGFVSFVSWQTDLPYYFEKNGVSFTCDVGLVLHVERPDIKEDMSFTGFIDDLEAFLKTEESVKQREQLLTNMLDMKAYDGCAFADEIERSVDASIYFVEGTKKLFSKHMDYVKDNETGLVEVDFSDVSQKKSNHLANSL